MYYMLLGFVPFIGSIIGTVEKPWKRKILLLTTSGTIIYIIGRATGDWNADPVILLINIIAMLITGSCYHLAHFHGKKKIRLKFWKKEGKEEQ